jgi:hypothetical protein
MITFSKNRFECLYVSEDEDDDQNKETVLSILPDEIINMIVSYNLTPTPTALIIQNRFDYYYDGVRTIYEINILKEAMEEDKKKYEEAQSKYSKYRRECYDKISEQEKLCTDDCKRILQEHLNTCTSTPSTCNRRYIAYDCKFKNNGRCSHYYKIEREQEDIDEYDYHEREYESKYNMAEHEYTKEIAKKEGWIDEYNENREREYENICEMYLY